MRMMKIDAHVARFKTKITPSFWENSTHQRQFLDWLAEEFQLDTTSSWYKARKSWITQHGGQFLLQLYDGSLVNILESNYPDTQWQPWRFEPHLLDSTFWDHLETQREFLESLGDQLQVSNLHDWYRVTNEQVSRIQGGSQFLERHPSLTTSLQRAFPEHEWHGWFFHDLPSDYWTNVTNVGDYFRWLGPILGVKKPEDWYKVTKEQVRSHGGSLLLERFGDSLRRAITNAFPDNDWELWRFGDLPQGFWLSNGHQRQFLDWVAEQLHVHRIEDWYKLKPYDLLKQGGGALLNCYRGSASRALNKVYPHTHWHPWLFEDVPEGFFEEMSNQRTYFEWLAEQLTISHFDEWYRVKSVEVTSYGGGKLISRYGMLSAALKAVFPDVDWIPWQFEELDENCWRVHRIQRLYMDWVAECLQLKDVVDWYNVQKRELLKMKGGGLMDIYKGSLPVLLQEVYPFTRWLPWLFTSNVQRGFWEVPSNQREYMNWLEDQLEIDHKADWYHKTTADLHAKGGSTLLLLFGSSLAKLLASVYPDFDWKPWLFDHAPQGLWDSMETQREYFEWLGSILCITKQEDWYQINTQIIVKHHGASLLQYYGGSLSQALEHVFPTTTWEFWQLGKVPAGFWEWPETQRNYFDWLAEQLQLSQVEDWHNVTIDLVLQHKGAGLMSLYNHSVVEALGAVYMDTTWFDWTFDLVLDLVETNLSAQRNYFDWLAESLGLGGTGDWYRVSKVDITRRGGKLVLDCYSGSAGEALRTVYPHTQWQPWLFEEVPILFWHSRDNRSNFFEWLWEELHIEEIDDWYQVKGNEITQRGGSLLIDYYGGSASQFLKEMLPHVDWQPWLFDEAPNEFWQDARKRRTFFDWLAEEFSVENSGDWYKLKKLDIQRRGGSKVFFTCGNSIGKVLRTIFPHTQWEPWISEESSESFWEDPVIQHEYLEWLGLQMEIKDEIDWYKIKRSDFVKHRGSQMLVNMYGSPWKAFVSIYSHIKWEPWLFDEATNTHWLKAENGRKYLEWLMQRLNFRSLDDWYLATKNQVIEWRGTSLLKFHGNSLAQALRSAFPEHMWHAWLCNEGNVASWSKYTHRRQFFDWLAEMTFVAKVEDWFKVKKATIADYGGISLLDSFYSGSHVNALRDVYPHTQWQRWQFERVPGTFWSSVVHQRQYFEWLGDQLEIISLEDWYKVKEQDIEQRGGAGLLACHGGSLVRALTALYPEYSWPKWVFQLEGSWENPESQREYFKWLCNKLNIRCANDWYVVRQANIIEAGGAKLLNAFGGSASAVLRAMYPEVVWEPWIFDEANSQYWEDHKNRRFFSDWLAERLSLSSPDDWYKVKKIDFIRNCGGGVLAHYSGSPSRLLKSIYPHTHWHPWLHHDVPSSFWKLEQNRRLFFDWAGDKLGVVHWEDWYSIRKPQVIELGGSGAISYLGNALYKALGKVYPEHNWIPWNFVSLPHKFWDEVNRRKWFTWLEKELNINKPSDWYGFTRHQILARQGGTVLNIAGTFQSFLRQFYPDFVWRRDQWQTTDSSKAQQFLFRSLRSIFSDSIEVELDYVSTTLSFESSSQMMTFDIWIPKFNMCLEYQGSQHYFPNIIWNEFAASMERDAQKAISCEQNGIYFVSIPYWWDFQTSSLATTISSKANISHTSGASVSSGLSIPRVLPFPTKFRLADGFVAPSLNIG